jgi:hypothetical protein
MPPSPRQCPHIGSYPPGLVIFGHHPPSRRLRIRTLPDEYVPALGSRNILNLTPPAHTRVPWCLSRRRCHFLISVHKTVFETPLPTTTSWSVEHQGTWWLHRVHVAHDWRGPLCGAGGVIPFPSFPNLKQDRTKLVCDLECGRCGVFHPWVSIGVGTSVASFPCHQALPLPSFVPHSPISATNPFTSSQTGGCILQQRSWWREDTGFDCTPHRCAYPQFRWS